MTLRTGSFVFFTALVFFCCLTRVIIADPDSSVVQKREFDKATWEKITRNIDYSNEKHPPAEVKTKNLHISFFSSGVLKIIFFSIVGGLLAFVVFRLLKGNLSVPNPAIRNDIHTSMNVSEEERPDADLRRLYNEAVEKGNFRQAVRIFYLLVIRELSARQFIRWRKEKTNREYLFEMMNHGSYSRFAEITLLFERIWYGEMELNEHDFRLVDPEFRLFLSGITGEVPFINPSEKPVKP